MSITTWKKEFYPTPASRCSKKNALAHSLRAWVGRLKKNLRKHGVTWGDVEDAWIDCALCETYDCYDCPLDVAGHNCYEGDSPYRRCVSVEDARPLVNALRKLVKAEKR